MSSESDTTPWSPVAEALEAHNGWVRMLDAAGEGILIAGGAAAILLQLADPRVAAGVAAHSDFVGQQLHRLHGTLTYLYVLAYGTDAERHRIARSVGEAHRPVADARDPGLQRWVAATLYWTAARIHDLVLTPIDDELYAEYATLGTALGMPQQLWPPDRAAFATYFDGYPVAVGDEARRIAQEVLHPRPWWARPAMPQVRVLTAGLLPPAVREAYGLEHDPVRFDRLLRRIRWWYPRLPRAVRELPMRRTLRRFRAEPLTSSSA